MYKNLFADAAEYYEKYRYGYPKEALDFVKKEFNLDGKGRLLDLGCGTGQLAIPLSGYFDEVVGVDPSLEMLEVAKKQALEQGAGNIIWIQGKSEDLDELWKNSEKFRLVTMGRSFHWMDRVKTLANLDKLIENDGGIVIVNIPSIWRETNEWQRIVLEKVKTFLGEERRAGDSKYSKSTESFEDTLSKSAFNEVNHFYFPFSHVWNVESIIGNLYSMSFCHPRLLKDKRVLFEQELREALLALNPNDRFVEENRAEVIIARRG